MEEVAIECSLSREGEGRSELFNFTLGWPLPMPKKVVTWRAPGLNCRVAGMQVTTWAAPFDSPNCGARLHPRFLQDANKSFAAVYCLRGSASMHALLTNSVSRE